VGVDRLENWPEDKIEYKEHKRKVIKTLLDRLNAQFPGIKDHILYTEMSTPRTIKKYTLNPAGTVYGFAQTPSQSILNRKRKYKSPIDNLLFASAWTFPGGGFSTVMTSGYIAAQTAIKKLKK